MATAIELYQKAYNLDYRKGDWEYAEQLYNEIVQKFPYSEERDYAQVHLERIGKLKANPNDQALLPVRPKGASVGLVLGCFVLIMILFVGTGFAFYLLYMENVRQNSNELILEGLLSEKVGDLDNAQPKYEEALKVDPNNAMAYRALAELYLEKNEFELAEIQSKEWELHSPYDINLQGFLTRMQAKKTKLSMETSNDTGR
jgi:tetratricopeptide (TPR) repeat protein